MFADRWDGASFPLPQQGTVSVELDKEGKLVTGFYAARTHAIIPVEDCLLGVEENKDVLMAVKEWMLLKQIPAYDETTGTGLVRHILIRYGFTTEEVMVCLIINGDRLPEKSSHRAAFGAAGDDFHFL